VWRRVPGADGKAGVPCRASSTALANSPAPHGIRPSGAAGAGAAGRPAPSDAGPRAPRRRGAGGLKP
jgi:hypothetical protein